MATTSFDLERTANRRDVPAQFISGIPLPSDAPSDGDLLQYDSTLNQFVWSQGALGPKGETGPTGPTGTAGGPQGIAGPVGIQGASPMGPTGLTGSQGPVGPLGPLGDPGDMGPTGSDGDQGDKGVLGATGPDGDAGIVGPDGPPGSLWRIINDPTTTDPMMTYDPAFPTTVQDNFVAGPQTTEGAGTQLFFINRLADSSFGSFRAGISTGTNWAQANRGENSCAMGRFNIASGDRSCVASGESNTASGTNSFVGGGRFNRATAVDSAVMGGGGDVVARGNEASGLRSFVGGGVNNRAQAPDSAVVGGGTTGNAGNLVTEPRSVIIGGASNAVRGTDSFIGGGQGNTIAANTTLCAIGGGTNNTCGMPMTAGPSFIGGGTGNTNNGRNCAIGGGMSNSIHTEAENCAIGGGTDNMILASGLDSVIFGGSNNACGGASSVVIGSSCINNSSNSCIMGRNVTNTVDGCLIWSCGSTVTNTDANVFKVAIIGAVADPNRCAFYSNTTRTTGVDITGDGTAWASVSDRRAKENITELDYAKILSKVRTLPLYQFNLKCDKTTLWRGPVAQDWHSAFDDLNKRDNLHISTMDADGVKLASLKALTSLTDALDERLTKMETAAVMA